MLRSGTKVTKLTKKVGQATPTGTIVNARSDSYEIKWDDGHTTIVSKSGVVPVHKKKNA